VLLCPTLYLRSVVVKLLLVDVLPMSFGSSPPVGWVMVCPVFEGLVSMSCPWAGLAWDALLRLVLLALCEVTGVLAVVVVARDYPTDRSSLLLGLLFVLVPVVAKTRTGRAQAAVPLGRAGAIAGTAVLSPCSMREEPWRGASRLLCRRLLRPRGSVVADCCSAKSCS